MKKSCHYKMRYATLATMIALALSGGTAYGEEGMPIGGKLIEGSVDGYAIGTDEINPVDNATLAVNANSVIDWNSFDIGAGKTLNFSGTGNYFLLNRVAGRNLSTLNGAMNITGDHPLNVILANQSGITIGQGASFSGVKGSHILLAAMSASGDLTNGNVTFTSSAGNGAVKTTGEADIKNVNLTMVGKTVEIADGITFSGDAALNLLAVNTPGHGPTSYTTDFTKNNPVSSFKTGGSITINGEIVDTTNKISFTATAPTVTMGDSGSIALTGAGSTVDIVTANLENANITADSDINVTYKESGSNLSSTGITVANSVLTSENGNVNLLSGVKDGTQLHPVYGYVSYSSGDSTNGPRSNVVVKDSSIAAKKVTVAGSGITIDGKKDDTRIDATDSVMIVSGATIPLDGSGTLTTENAASVEITGNAVQSENINVLGRSVSINGSELKGTETLNIVAGDSITLGAEKPTATSASYGISLNAAKLQGETINLAGNGITVSDAGMIGTADTGNVNLLSGRTIDIDNKTIDRPSNMNINGGTIQGEDILAAGANVTVQNASTAIHATGDTGKVRLLAGTLGENEIVTTRPDNTVNVNSNANVTGNTVMLAGGAVNVNGGKVGTAESSNTDSVYLLAGNSIDTVNVTATSEKKENVITSGVSGNASNKVSISNGANINANDIHIAGYEAELSSTGSNTSKIHAINSINAVTGSTIQNNNGTLERQQTDELTRGRFSRDTASEVKVGGEDSSAMIDMPTDGRVTVGSIKYHGVDYDSSHLLNLQSNDWIETKEHSIIDWRTFDIGTSGVLNFNTTYGALLNRVTGNLPSWLQGTLNHTGSKPLILVNPNGIDVYNGASIKADNLILSGLKTNMDGTALGHFVDRTSAATFGEDSSDGGDITFESEAEVNAANLALLGRNITVPTNVNGTDSLTSFSAYAAKTVNLNTTGEAAGFTTDTSADNALSITGALNSSNTTNLFFGGKTVSLAPSTDAGKTIVAKAMKVDATGSATLSGLNYTGKLTGNSILDDNGKNLTLSGGTYKGDVGLKGQTVTLTGITFDGDDKQKDIALSGGANGTVNITNSRITNAKDVTLSGRIINVTGNSSDTWTMENFTAQAAGGEINTTNISNIDLTITKAGTSPVFGSTANVTLNNTKITAPKIDIAPNSLTVKGGSVLTSSGNVDIKTSGATNVEGNSSLVAGGNINVQASSINVGKTNETDNSSLAANGTINLQAGAFDGETAVSATDNTLNIAAGELTAGGDIDLLAGNVNVTGNGTRKSSIISTAGNILAVAASCKTATEGKENREHYTFHDAANKINIENAALTTATDATKSVTLMGYDVSTIGTITTNTLTTSVDDTDGTLTVGGNVTVNKDLELNGGKQITLDGVISAPSVTVSSKEVAVSGATVTATSEKENGNSIEVNATNSVTIANSTLQDSADSGDISITGKTIATEESRWSSSAINSAHGNILFVSGSTADGNIYTTTEGGSINLEKMTITGNTVTALAKATSITDGTIHANTLQAAAADTVDVADWTTDSTIVSDNNKLNLDNIVVTNKEDSGAIGNVKLAGSSVSFGGTADTPFSAESVAVKSGSDLTISAGQLDVTGETGLDLSGKSITVDGTVNAKKITLTAKDNNAILNSGSVLNAKGGANTIAVTADKGDITADGSLNADGITVTATAGNVTASGSMDAKTIALTAGTGKTVELKNASSLTAIGETAAVNVRADSGTIKANGDIAVKASAEENAVKSGVVSLDADDVTIGDSGSTGKSLSAKTLTVTAPNSISMERTAVDVTDDLSLSGKTISTNNNKITTAGTLTLTGTDETSGTAVNVSGGTLEGTNVTITAAAGEVSVSGDLIATDSDITLNSGDSSTITATGKLQAEHGTITLGHSDGEHKTQIINIGGNTQKEVKAKEFNIHATDEINIKNADVEVTDSGGLALSSKAITITDSLLNVTRGDLDINKTTGTGDILLNGTGGLKAEDGNINIGNADSKNVEIAFYNPDNDVTVKAKNIAVEGNYVSVGDSPMEATDGNIILRGHESGAYNYAIQAYSMTANNEITFVASEGGRIQTTGRLSAEKISINEASGAGDISVAGTLIAGTDENPDGSIVLGNDATMNLEIWGTHVRAKTLNAKGVESLKIGTNTDVEVSDSNGLVLSSNAITVDNSSHIKNNSGGITLTGTGTGAVTVTDSALDASGTLKLENSSGSIIVNGKNSLPTYTNLPALQGTSVTITGSDVTIGAANKATNANAVSGNMSIISTGAGKDVTLTNATLTATKSTDENVADGNVSVTSERDILASDGFVNADGNITLEAKHGTGVMNNDAIALRGGDSSMTAGGNILLKAAKGNIAHDNSLNAENGTITINAMDGSITTSTENAQNINIQATGNIDTYNEQSASEKISITSSDGDIAIHSSRVNAPNIAVTAGTNGNTGKKITTSTSYVTAIGDDAKITFAARDGQISTKGGISAKSSEDDSAELAGEIEFIAKDIGIESEYVAAKKLTLHDTPDSESADSIYVRSTDISTTDDLILRSGETRAAGATLVTAAGNLTIESTGIGKDVTLTDAALNAVSTSEGKGNIHINSASGAVVATGGSMMASREIAFNKENSNAGRITVSGTLTAERSTGEKDGTITIGNNSTEILTIGQDTTGTDSTAVLMAGVLAAHASDKIETKNAGIEVTGTDGLSLSSKEIAVTNSTMTATSGDLSVASTDASKDLVLADANLTASGIDKSINITSAKSITATGGSMNASKDIHLLAATGGVSVSGDLSATNGNITLDSDNGSAITATGNMNAGDTIIVGHKNIGGKADTTAVVIGADTGSRTWETESLNINAVDSISVKNTDLNVTNDTILESGSVDVSGSGITATDGDISLKSTGKITATDSTFRTEEEDGGIHLMAGSFDDTGWTADAIANTIELTNTGIDAAGDVSFKAGKIDISTDADKAAKTIGGKNLFLAAANSYTDSTKTYGMDSANTIQVVNTNLTGKDSITLLGYKTSVTGDVTTSQLLGAVGQEIVLKSDGRDVASFVSPSTPKASLLTIQGNVQAENADELIYIKLYGDAEFYNKNDGLKTMSFSADSPYSLDISGDMTVTDESGIRLSSDSIRIKDDLTASHANASIELGSTGGEMNVSGNLTAGKDVIIKSKKNIVVGDENKEVTLKATTGNVNLLAGTLDTDGDWTGGTGATESDQENNIAITNTNIIAAQNVDIMGGSVSITGAGKSISSTGGDITIAAAKEFDGTTDTYTTEAGNQVSLSGETLLANNIYILGNKTDLNGTIQTDNLQAAAGETVAKDDTAKTLTNTAISEEGNALTLKGTVQGRENSAAGTIHLMGDIAIGDADPATNTSLKSNKFLAEKLFGEGAKQAIDVLNIQNTDISVNAIGTKDINAGTINLTESSITVGSMDEHGINAEAIHLTDSELKATEASVLAADEITVTDSTLEGTENLNLKGESVTLQSTAGKANSFSGNVNIDASETAKIAGAAEKKAGASSAHLAIEADNIAIGEDDSSVHVGVTGISLKTKNLVVNNNVTADGAVELQGETVSIGSTVSAGDDLSIIATDSLQVNGTVSSAKDIEFKGKTVNIGSEGGTAVVTAGDDLSITAEGTGNSVTIQNTNLTSGSDASDKMTITGDGVTFEGTNTLSGTIEVNAADEASIAGMNTLSGTVDIRAVNTANITGTIAKSGSAELSVQAKNMEIGGESADSASIAVDKLDMTGTEQAIVRNATIATANGATLAGENVYLQGANSLQGILEISATDKASVTGTTVSKDSAADLIIHAKNVAIGGESADANIAVDKFTVSSTDSIVSETVAAQNANITAADAATIAGKNVTLTGGILNAGTTVDITSEQASINGTKLKVDTQVTADQVDLAGELDAAGKTLTLNAATIHIGDGSAETSVTAKSIATVDATENLEINKAAISTDTTILKAQDAVKLKDSSIITKEASIEATGAEGIIQSTNTDIRITGEGKDLKLESKNVEVSGGSLSAATKNVEIKATDATLKGVINATGQGVKLNATNVNIGDGSLNTSVTASSIATVDATKNIETNKATLATDTAILKAQDAVELKDSSIVTKEASIEATGADGVIQSTNTDIRITGEGKDLKLESKNVEVSGGSLSAATKNVEIKATDATFKGVINATGQDVKLNATNVNIGDGSLNTSVTAKSIATVDATESLETNKAAISTDTASLKAQDVVKLKDSSIITEEASIEATGAEGIIQSTDTDISITGEDNDLKLEGNSVEISGGSLTAATKNVEIKATDGTTLKGVINAEGQDVKLNATNVNIGDGSIVTSVNAHSIEAVATGEIVASKAAITVDQQEGSISLLAARAENITTTSVPQVDDEGNAIFDENNDPVMDTITARTLTLDENNQVLIDNSRLDGADISLAGYSVAVKNNSAIYARKTLDALAGTELTSQNGGKLEVTGQAAEDAEVQNTVIQENSVIQVAGRSWNNFQPVPDPVYSPSAGTETTPETPETPEPLVPDPETPIAEPPVTELPNPDFPIEPTVVVEPSAKPVPSGEESLPEIANVVQMAGQSLVSRYVNTGFSSWRGQTYYTFHGGYRGFGQYFPQHRDAFDGGASDNKVTFEPFFDMLWPMADPVMGNHDIDSEEEDDDKSA